MKKKEYNCHFLYRNIFPDNLLQACFQHTKTEYVIDDSDDKSKNTTNTTVDAIISTMTTITTTLVDGKNITTIEEVKWKRTFPMSDGINVLGVYILDKKIDFTDCNFVYRKVSSYAAHLMFRPQLRGG